ncbi:MAG: phosphatidate cytidylyltransferase [Alphaproteobacteria bacterium]|nr:phosphatidate cytidylyltransferase [Alphaproteobacteria bacterium]
MMIKRLLKSMMSIIKAPFIGLNNMTKPLKGIFKFMASAPAKILKPLLGGIFKILKAVLKSPFKAMDKGFEYGSYYLQKWMGAGLKGIGKGITLLGKVIWEMLLPVRNPDRWLRENYRYIANRIVEDQNFANRFFSSVIMVLIAIPVIIFGGWPLQLLMIVVMTISAWEWGGLAPSGVFTQKRITLTLCIAATMLLMRPLGPAAPALITIFLFIDIFIPKPSVERAFHNQIGFSYLFVAALSFGWIHDNFGALATLWLVLTVIATDIAAFVGGRAFGGAKLAPSISPNKTFSGSLCALGAAGVIGFLYAGIDGKPVLFFIFLSLFVSIMAQVGDLFESMLKRRANVKDSGNIIPGHGGVLDRIDGFLMASPAAFVALKIAEWLN